MFSEPVGPVEVFFTGPKLFFCIPMRDACPLHWKLSMKYGEWEDIQPSSSFNFSGLNIKKKLHKPSRASNQNFY